MRRGYGGILGDMRYMESEVSGGESLGGYRAQREKVAEVLPPDRARVFLIRLGGFGTRAVAALPV